MIGGCVFSNISLTNMQVVQVGDTPGFGIVVPVEKRLYLFTQIVVLLAVMHVAHIVVSKRFGLGSNV